MDHVLTCRSWRSGALSGARLASDLASKSVIAQFRTGYVVRRRTPGVSEVYFGLERGTATRFNVVSTSDAAITNQIAVPWCSERSRRCRTPAYPIADASSHPTQALSSERPP